MNITDPILIKIFKQAHEAAMVKENAERILKQSDHIIENLKSKFPMGGEQIKLNNKLIAVINSPRKMTKTNEAKLNLTLAELDTNLSNFQTTELSNPSWSWMPD